MNESILNSTETEVESQTEGVENENADADDDGWDAVTWGSDEEDAGEEDGGMSPEGENPEADQPTENAEQEPDKEAKPNEPQPEQPPKGEDQFLELKHMDEVKKVSLEEAKTLAQKGLDYDRIRGERDEMSKDYGKLKEYESFLNELKGDFPDIETMMTDTRARMLADKDGIPYADAVAKVKLKQPQQQAVRADQTKGNEAVQKFVERYPGVKAEDIPQSVWDEVKKTGDLTGAYAAYERQKQADEIADLKKQIATLEQNQKNASRSPGSANTSGKTSAKSLIQQLWEADDD